MKSIDEKGFYEALGIVPDVPVRVFENVERHVRRSGVKRRTALAACLLLAFIIPALVFKQISSPSVVYAEKCESMDELLYAFEFLHGDDETDWLFNADFASGNGNVDTVSKFLAASKNNDSRKGRSSED